MDEFRTLIHLDSNMAGMESTAEGKGEIRDVGHNTLCLTYTYIFLESEINFVLK